MSFLSDDITAILRSARSLIADPRILAMPLKDWKYKFKSDLAICFKSI